MFCGDPRTCTGIRRAAPSFHFLFSNPGPAGPLLSKEIMYFPVMLHWPLARRFRGFQGVRTHFTFGALGAQWGIITGNGCLAL